MSLPRLRKISREGSCYSVVEQDGINHIFATVVSRPGGSLRDQARDALQALAKVMSAEGAAGAVVHQAMFGLSLTRHSAW